MSLSFAPKWPIYNKVALSLSPVLHQAIIRIDYELMS